MERKLRQKCGAKNTKHYTGMRHNNVRMLVVLVLVVLVISSPISLLSLHSCETNEGGLIPQVFQRHTYLLALFASVKAGRYFSIIFSFTTRPLF